MTVIGGNADGVTGSCTKIEYFGHTTLFELGMIQDGHTPLENYKRNKQLLSKIRAKNIEKIIIGHNHIDHIGMIPALYNKGGNAKIIVPKGSTSIIKEMWLDSAYINQRDCEFITQRYNKDYLPLFTKEDVDTALSHIEEYVSNEIFKLDDFLSLRYIPAGHILFSQQCELYFKHNNHIKKAVFTSDLGNTLTQDERVFVEPLKPIVKANIVIGECTYSKRDNSMIKRDLQLDKQKMQTVIQQFCVENNHRVLIPTFSLDRFPLIMWELYSQYGNDTNFDIPIILDSPLSNRLLDCYSSVLEGKAKNRFDEMMAWKNFKKELAEIR